MSEGEEAVAPLGPLGQVLREKLLSGRLPSIAPRGWDRVIDMYRDQPERVTVNQLHDMLTRTREEGEYGSNSGEDSDVGPLRLLACA